MNVKEEWEGEECSVSEEMEEGRGGERRGRGRNGVHWKRCLFLRVCC